MTQRDHAINTGVWRHNASPCPPEATVAVIGLGRSGTTMVARVLTEMGLFMGKPITPRSHEDKQIQLLIKDGDFDAFANLCRERDSRYGKWGFKCPALRSELVRAAPLMREARVLVIFRDVLAISVSEGVYNGAEVFEAVRGSIKSYRTMVDQLDQCGRPVLALSYEKALQFPEACVMAIADFCGLRPDDAVLARAVGIIRNGDEKYARRMGGDERTAQ